MIGIGFIVANWVGYGCQFLDGNTAWRLSLGLQLVPAFLLLVGIQFLPFSPVFTSPFVPCRLTDASLVKRWLLEQNRDDEARAVVYRLHGSSTPDAKEAAEREFLEMHDVIKAEASERSRKLSDLWETRAMLKRTLVAVGVQVMGQFSGINGSLVKFKSNFIL